MTSGLVSRLRAGPWPFILVSVLAALPRLASLTLIDYRYDEAVAVHFAFDIADGRWLVLAPMSGSVATHPPLSLYVMAVPALLSRNVLWVAGFRAALDVVAVGLLGVTMARVWGRVGAFVGALAYALGPWAVYFARKTPVTSIGLFATIALIGALVLVGRRRARGWPIATLGVALALGSHLSSVYLLPALVIVLLLGRRNLTPGLFLAGVLPLVLVGVGYAAADAPGGFRNIQALFRAQGGGGLSMATVDFALFQTSAAKLAEIVGLKAQFAPEGSVLDAVNLLPQALSLLGPGLAIAAFLRKRSDSAARSALAAAAFWASVVLLQVRSVAPAQPHYVQMAMPAAFALIGYAASVTWKWATARSILWPRFGLAVIVLGVAAYDLAYTGSLNAAAAGAGPFPGYRPVAAALGVADSARALAASCPAGEILIGVPGANPEVDDQAAVFSTLLADRQPRLFDSRVAVLTPAGCGIWALAPEGGPALAAFGFAGGGAVRAASLPWSRALRGRWAHGIEALGAGVGIAGNTWATATLRVMEGGISGEDAHWFARLESGGRQLASRDIAGVRPSDWRVGDTIGLYFDFGPLQLDQGIPITLRIGSYRYPELSGIGVNLPDGTWADALTLELAAP